MTTRKRVLQQIDIMDTAGFSGAGHKRLAPLPSPPSSPNPWEENDTVVFPRPFKSNKEVRKQDQTVTRPEMVSFLNSLKQYKETDFLETAPEKASSFFLSWDCHHLGNLISIRRATVEGRDNIYIRKDNLEYSPSILKFDSRELEPFLRETLIPLYKKITSTPLHVLFPIDTIHDYNSPDFWLDESVVSNPSREIKIRPYILSERGDTKLQVRLWMPITPPVELKVKGGKDKVWHGPVISLATNTFLGVITILGSLLEDMWKSSTEGGENRSEKKPK